MDPRIIYQGQTKKGTPITIRYPLKADASLLQTYINTLSDEKTFIRFQGEQMSLEDEQNWINSQIEAIKDSKAVMLIAEHQGRIIGNTTIGMRQLVESHIGLFGLTVAKDFRGEGIGKMLMEQVFEQAIKKLPQLKIVVLEVFGNNPRAIKIYKNFGFVQYGNLPEGILHKGKYVNHLSMYKKVQT